MLEIANCFLVVKIKNFKFILDIIAINKFLQKKNNGIINDSMVE